MKYLRIVLGIAVLAVACFPALAQDETDLPTMRAELERLQRESEQLTADYQAAWAEDAALQARIEELQLLIASYGIDLRRLRDQIRDRAVNLYMDGVTSSDLPAFFLTISPSELDRRAEYLRDLRRQDQTLFNNLETLTRQLEESVENLMRGKQEQEMVLARLEQLGADLNERLEAGQATYALLQQREAEERARREAEERARIEAEQEAERQRAAEEEAARTAAATTSSTSPSPPPTTAPTTTPGPETTSPPSATTTPTTQPPPTTTSSTTTPPTIPVTDSTIVSASPPVVEGQPENILPDGMTCPVDGFSTFSDTWGAPRSGGRSHEGVDMLAARGTPVVAVESGLIERMRRGGLGGITVWLQGRSGDDYYYAHLDAWAAGLSVGQQVSVGQPLGVVGTTGNSPDHIPHLHWEYHPGGFTPGGRTAINPTPLARELCG